MFSLTEIDLDGSSNLSFSVSDQNGWTTLYEPEPDIYKEEEEDLWMLSEYREWKTYIKSLWMATLRRKKQELNLFKAEQRIILYCLRLMLPISGWIARVGYRKKRN